jgi:general secretion pathway protein H
MEHERGFSLIEMLVVLGIMAAVLGIALPSFNSGTSPAQVESAATELASTLRATRAAAVAGGQPVDFSIDVARGSFAGDGALHRLTADEDMHVALYTTTGALSSATSGAIRFYPDGGSSGGGITVSSGARFFVVAVDWLSGAVSVRQRTEETGM